MSSTSTPDTWLITGGSGFLALHCISQTLAAGHKVRTTVRSASKQASILSALDAVLPPVDSSDVEFVVTDLLSDEGWDQAMDGISVVLHTASPFPGEQPKDENKVIKPAVEGTIRVLKAAKKAGTVRRVVVTSSNAAISYGHPYVEKERRVFTEKDWTNLDGEITPYTKSKTMAEKAAWEYIKGVQDQEEDETARMELTVVNPVGIFGPALLLPNESTTCGIIVQMLEGAIPAVPNVRFGVVDVRDVAALHILVATLPEASGERYIAVAGESVSLLEVGKVLIDNLDPEITAKVPRRQLPNYLVRGLSWIMPQLTTILPDLGKKPECSSEKAKTLGWVPRTKEEAIVSCAKALLEAGVIKK